MINGHTFLPNLSPGVGLATNRVTWLPNVTNYEVNKHDEPVLLYQG